MNIIEAIFKKKIYAVVRTKDADLAYNISQCLISGGVNIIEIPLVNDDILEVIKQLSQDENNFIAAGGIITTKQAEQAFNNNCKMLVSPIFQRNIAKLSQAYKIPVITTVSTANEAYEAWQARVPIIKLYPATPMGGVDYISDLLRPMPFLNLMPNGDIKIEQITSYLKAGAVAVGIGADFYKNFTNEQITQRAEKAVEIIENLKD